MKYYEPAQICYHLFWGALYSNVVSVKYCCPSSILPYIYIYERNLSTTSTELPTNLTYYKNVSIICW